MHVSRSLKRRLRRSDYEVTFDRAFGDVLAACAAPRQGRDGTWLVPSMMRAYKRLHDAGAAHSIEVWMDGELAGGLYGVALGRMFYGESMFTRRTDGSKIAIVALAAQLARWDFPLIDCQMRTAHLASLGAPRCRAGSSCRRSIGWCGSRRLAAPWAPTTRSSPRCGNRGERARERRIAAQRIERRIAFEEHHHARPLFDRLPQIARSAPRAIAEEHVLHGQRVRADPARARRLSRRSMPPRQMACRPLGAVSPLVPACSRRRRRGGARRLQRRVVQPALRVGALETRLRFERVGLDRQRVLARARRVRRPPEVQIQPADVVVRAHRQRIEIARRR